MSSVWVLTIFVICIVLMIVLISKAKMHAVTALLLAVLLLAIGLGTDWAAIEGMINKGFADTIKSIGIVIMLGCLLGKILEETGAAQAITLSIIKLVGQKNVIWAISISGFILGIPIFSDTVTILLIPIVSNLALETSASMMAYGSALAVGAQITHSIVAPTPGPVAAAGLLGVPLGIAIPWGIVVSIPGIVAATLWSKYACKEMVLPKQEYVDSYNMSKGSKLPGTIMSFMPIVLPLFLIVLNNVFAVLAPGTYIASLFSFVGSPMAALISGCIMAMILTGPKWKTKLVLNDWVEEALHSSAMPLFVTGMGGALALFIKEAGVAEKIAEGIVGANIPGIIVPIVISVVVHVITGSSTLAVMTSAGLVQPMLGIMGITPLAAFLACSSAGLMFKHGNSSAFWVGTSLSNMSFTQGLKGIGGGCTVASIACCLTTIILSMAQLI